MALCWVLGIALEPLELFVERRMEHKLLNIMDNTTHPLHNLLVRQQSVFSQRLLQLCCNKDRYRRSFLPTPIAINNESPLGRERR